MKKLKGFVGKFLALSFTVGIMSISLITPSYAGQVSKQILRDESAQTSDNLVDENALDEDSKGQNTADSSDLEEGTTNSNEQVKKTNQEKPDFTDVSETDWFYADVMELAGMGIISGYPSGEFAATDYITSEQFIKMVVVGFGYKTNDNTLGKWYKKYTDIMENRGVVVNNEVVYGQPITREQIARIIARSLKLEGMINDKGKDTLIRNAISDYNKISSEYEEDILDSYYFGIMQGNQEKVINPQGKLTRAEAASIILRMIKKDRRMALNLVDNSICEVFDYYGDDVKINIPYYDGVLQRELADVVNILIDCTEKDKGSERIGAEARGVSISCYETDEKREYMDCRGLSEAEINEKLVMMPWKLDATTTVNFENYSKIDRGTAPYFFRVSKNLAETEQEKYDHNYEMYKEYFLEYYEEMYVDAFKYLFEDDFDEVWKLFCTALENRYSGYTKDIGQSKTDHVEGWYVFNDRQVFINYSAHYVDLYVSLKGVRYEK